MQNQSPLVINITSPTPPEPSIDSITIEKFVSLAGLTVPMLCKSIYVIGTKTLASNFIVDVSGDTFTIGDTIQLWFQSTMVAAGHSVLICGENYTSFIATGSAVNVTVGIKYNGSTWYVESVDKKISSALAAYVAPVLSVAGKTGVVTLVKADVGLSNVDNTSDANKPVSTAQGVAISNAQTAASAVGSAAQTTANTALSDATNALSQLTALTALATVATWAAGTQAVVPTANFYYLEVTALNGNVVLNFTPLSLSTAVSEITIFLGFTGTYTVTNGSNSVFPMITGAASIISVLTLAWNGSDYIQKSFSQP